MTDEKIKEEFEKSRTLEIVPGKYYYEYDGIQRVSFSAFYVGFRAAERIAKIEVLEKLLINMESLSTQSAVTTIDDMLSELKAGQ